MELANSPLVRKHVVDDVSAWFTPICMRYIDRINNVRCNKNEVQLCLFTKNPVLN